MDIVIDFDGTCVTHAYPKVGADIGAAPVLRDLVSMGHRLVLFTMRSNTYTGPYAHKEGLTEAVEWFEKEGIELFGVQTNPEQSTWTISPKAYGKLIIDDAALGIPLITNTSVSKRPYVNWTEVRQMLVRRGLLDF